MCDMPTVACDAGLDYDGFKPARKTVGRSHRASDLKKSFREMDRRAKPGDDSRV
jgi:hypothetical protein